MVEEVAEEEEAQGEVAQDEVDQDEVVDYSDPNFVFDGFKNRAEMELAELEEEAKEAEIILITAQIKKIDNLGNMMIEFDGVMNTDFDLT